MACLSILTQEEINSLYSIPHLENEERSFLFTLDVILNDPPYVRSVAKEQQIWQIITYSRTL